MPNLKNIKALIYANQWAILPDALSAMISFIEGADISDLRREDFHGMSEAQWTALTVGFGERTDETRYTRVSGNVGLLEINGPMVPKATMLEQASGLVSTSILSAEFQALDEDPAIEKIVMLIDSPGGAVPGISEFAQQIRAAETPTLSFIGGLAASSAYWLASAADAIAAIDTAIVGGIGTVMTFCAHCLDGGGNKIEIISSQSPRKNLDPRTTDGQGEYQSIVDDLASVFIQAVAEGRGTTAENVQENFGQGGMMVAARAGSVGMIDQIGTMRGAIEAEIPERAAFTAGSQLDLDVSAGTPPFKDFPIADKPWDADAAIGRVRKFTDSTKEPSARYKSAFFWYDPKDAKKFGSYKLPFVDIVDGDRAAIRRGVFAADGAMGGARGGVDIPAKDRPAVQRHIDRYKAKIKKEDEKEKAKSEAEIPASEKSPENGLTAARKTSTKDQEHSKPQRPEDRPMAKLKDLVEANPEIEPEITELKVAAEKKGGDSVVARVEAVFPILTSPVYPESIKAIVREFIEGTKTETEYKAAVSGFDAATEAARAATAELEGEEAAATPPPPPDGGGEPDGVVRDEASFQAAQASFKAARGEQ